MEQCLHAGHDLTLRDHALCTPGRIVCIRHEVCLMVFIVLYAYTRESTSRKGVHVKQYTFTIHEIK
jgi:hypothetical protein